MKTTTEKALALCHAIEAAGASEQLTACSVLASEILADVQKLEAATCEFIPKKTHTELWQEGQTGAAFQAALWEADQLRARVATAEELSAAAKKDYTDLAANIVAMLDGTPPPTPCNLHVTELAERLAGKVNEILEAQAGRNVTLRRENEELRARVAELEKLYKAVTDALPVIRYFENTLASSLSSDSRSHDQDRQPRMQLNALMEAHSALTERLSENDAANIIYRASKQGGWHK